MSPSQGFFSTNWKPGAAASKPGSSSSDTTKVTSVVHNATQRALRAATSSSPRTTKMKRAPTSGRKVTTERIGQSDIVTLRRT